jgi:tripartite-type tricarboxylate transporter receptor subunit TctC
MTYLFRLAASALLAACMVGSGMLGAGTAGAQDYPTRPIFFVVGPGPDALARLIGQKLTAAWGQQVLIDIQPTAGGVVAARSVAKAAPDGHTMLLTTGSYTIMQAIRPDLQFNLLRDFEPVVQIGSLSFLLLAKSSLAVKSLDDLIRLARAKPGQINCASSGVGTTAHLGCEMLKKFADIDIVHVPYKGAGPALTDLIGGYVDIFFAVPTTVAQVKSGEVRALAVTGRKRLAVLPEVPTVAEAGLPDLAFGSWNGVHVPAATPKPIITKLNAEIGKARNLPDIQQRMTDFGFTPEGGTPEEFGDFVKRDLAGWTKIVKETGVKVE